MSVRCAQCGAQTVWDDQVGSAVCTECGSLVDPSQSVLTSAQQNDFSEASLWDPAASTTLKSLRSGNNWDLAGQGKEARDRRNAYAMVDFIKSLALSFNAPGLSPRAITLFNQARSAISFRWGKKSRSVAGACLAIALRESNRPDALRDIASVLGLPPTSVSRDFTSITSTLALSLTLVDPSVHIPALEVHLPQHVSGLPVSLIKVVNTLSLRSVANTAVSLSHLLARLSPNHELLRLPVPPTSCAIFLLALEAEHRAPLNPLGDLAKCLAIRFQSTQKVVMTRYKALQDEVASWAENVPWLDKYETKQGRTKISKRLVVARGLKDVIQFQEDIWKQRARPSLHLELDDDETKDDDDDLDLALPPERPKKQTRSKSTQALTQAARFLLDPLGHRQDDATSATSRSSSPAASQLPLITYLLINPSASGSRRPPTRLQLLATIRGGADEEHIPDSDLFSDGELENIFRSDEDVLHLREVFGWPEGEDHDPTDDEDDGKSRRKRKRRRTSPTDDIIDPEADILGGSALRLGKKSRLNFDALSQFMAGDHDVLAADDDKSDDDIQMMGLEAGLYQIDEELDADYALDDENQVDGPGHVLHETTAPPNRQQHSSSHSVQPSTAVDTGGEVILDAWRPPSPGSGVLFNDSRYEEERPP